MSLTIKRAVSIIEAQGGSLPAGATRSLQAAGLLPTGEGNLTAENLVNLLLAFAAPESADVVTFVTSRGNCSALRPLIYDLSDLFDVKPHKYTVLSFCVSQTVAACWIRTARHEAVEYIGKEFSGQGVRKDVEFSGGLIAALSLKLHFDTAAGWVKEPKPE